MQNVKAISRLLIISIIFLFNIGINKSLAQISQVDREYTAYSTGTSLTLTKPTGVAVGDIMFINVTNYYASAVTPTMSGWTTIASGGLGGSSSPRGTVFYRLVDGTEGNTFTVNLSNNSYAAAAIIAFTGIDSANPFDVTPPSAIRTTTTTATSVTGIPSVTTVSSNTMILMFSMCYASTVRTISNWTVATSPSLTTEYSYNGTARVSVGCASGVKNTVGATGNGSFSLSNSGYAGGILLALRPADVTVAGNNSWIGYIYSGSNRDYSTDTYKGYYTESETFYQNFGGNYANFTIASNGSTIYTEGFSVRYRMNSTKKGLYIVDLSSDDGVKLSVDNTEIYRFWTDHAITTHTNVLMNLTGTSSLVYDFYENGGENIISFQNLRLVLANQLTTNTTQGITLGSSGSAISGDAFGTLETGISLKSTGYQWYYSTSPTGTQTAISGATGPTFTPNTSVAPFNAAGTYYLFRYASLNSSNNVGYTTTPFTATNVSNYATVTVLNPVLNVSQTTLNGFTYVYDNGPSAEQTFVVSGSDLPNNVTLSVSGNYEISATSGYGYGNSITLPKTGYSLSGTTVYVRLKVGLPAGTYNRQLITVSSSPLAGKTVTCNGNVTEALPVITASGGYDCASASIKLFSNLDNVDSSIYWQGPNNFYSTQQNPVITSPTSANNGTYTVYGTVPSGINLITNGDFESGNTGFTSSYTNNQSNLQAEGTYAVVKNPNSVHSGFTNCPDHASGSGYQMVINGATTSNVTIWSQTVSCTPNTYYQFTYWLQSVVNYTASQLQLFANNVSVGPVYTASLTLCNFNKYLYNWNSGSATSVKLELKNMNIIAGGNDFAIDDVAFQSVMQVTSSVNVAVNSTAPSVAIVADATNVVAGTAVTFTATPTNGGATPTYQWKVNGVNLTGENQKTFTYVPKNGDVVTCQITSGNSCSNPATALSNSVTITVTARNNYWLGNVSTDWGNPANWTDHVPLTNEDVVFASVASGYSSEAQRDLILDINRTIGNLINISTSGKRLIIPSGKQLEVNGEITCKDNNPALIYIQSSSSAPNGSFIFYTSTPVYGTVEMYSKASWDLSQSSVNDKYKWQFFGIPLKTLVANPALFGAYVRRMLESGTTISNHWELLVNSSALQSFTGYEICQEAPKTYYFSGQLENSNKTIGAPFAVTSGALYPGQHLLANPYTAAVSVSNIIFGSDMEKTVYLYSTGTFNEWQSHTSSQEGTSPGMYISIPQANAGVGSIPSQVPSMSSMLVRANAATTNAYVTFDYSNVVVRNTDMQRVPALRNAGKQSVTTADLLMISVEGKRTVDRMWLIDNENCSEGFDNGYDGTKISGNDAQSAIYSVTSAGRLQVNTTNNIDNSVIGFKAGADTVYTLRIRNYHLNDKYSSLYLYDIQENNLIDLAGDSAEYQFSAHNTTGPVNRFRIIGRKATVSASGNVFVFTNHSMIYVRNISGIDAHIRIYDVTGKIAAAKTLKKDELLTMPARQNIVYIVTSLTDKGSVSDKILVR
jgi:hypothetical protein